MKVFGVSGYIGSGKSTLCGFLEKFGARYIDADKITHELYKSGMPGQRKIELFFGEDFLDKKGNINRKKLGKVVFNDVRKLKILNNLIHPLVVSEVEKMMRKSSAEICVIEATYFEKKHLGRFIDALIWVKRKNLPADSKILNLQRKPEHVDFTVENNGSKKDLENNAKKLWQKLTSLR